MSRTNLRDVNARIYYEKNVALKILVLAFGCIASTFVTKGIIKAGETHTVNFTAAGDLEEEPSNFVVK